MGKIDPASLLTDISPDAPSGENLMYDAAYLEMERLAQGTPEQQVGDSKTEAQEPDWKGVFERASSLLERTKDLRVCMYLSMALMRMEGLNGLRDGLKVLAGLLDKFWPTVYPQLDPEDNNDPMERMNILATLSSAGGSVQDPMSFKFRIREIPLVAVPQLGKFTLRDMMIAKGELAASPNSDAPQVDQATIDAAFSQVSEADLRATADVAKELVGLMQAIDATVTEKVGSGGAPDLSDLTGTLQTIQKTVDGYMASRGLGGADGAPAPTVGEGGGGVQAGDGGGRGGSPLTGDIRTRQDVITALEKVCRYYEKNEPSSPVPLLLKRALKLASKNFLEIIRDMTPDAVKQIEMIGGIDSEQESN